MNGATSASDYGKEVKINERHEKRKKKMKRFFALKSLAFLTATIGVLLITGNAMAACADYQDKTSCNADPLCTYDNKNKVCIDDPNACVPSGPEICTGGVDEDCNGLIDCADTIACSADPVCAAGACSDYSDKTSCNGNPGCEWDNKNKVCNDVACTPTGPEICTGGVDEDCNGLIDCADTAACGTDPVCTGGGVEDCKDGIDNDGDGKIDCADTDCSAEPSCADPNHSGINQYDGPQTCIGCHGQAGSQMLNSVHGTWNGATPNVTNIPYSTGKWGQSNNYCTDAEMADFACLKCHVSNVGPPTGLTENNMDCLQCHQNTYQATFGGTVETTYTSCVDGSTKTYMFPAKEADGKYHKVARFDLMPAGTTMVELARTVHRPDNASCLMPCHAKAGGGDGTKRGDLGSDMVDPPVNQDVHLSSAGVAQLQCTSCHVAVNHQIPGRGNDIRPEDTGATMKQCVDCHTGMDSGSGHGTATAERQAADRHVARVACTSCHIDMYGKGIGTEVSRDWRLPVWNPGGCEGQGAWVGEEVRGTNLVPEYRFWDGTSWVYDRDGNDALIPDTIDGGVALSLPNGDINNGKLYPFKVHTSMNPINDSSGKTNFDVLQMFTTGCYDSAAVDGLAYIGETGSYTWTETEAFQLITHGVAPKTTANDCAKCHGSIDFTTDSKLDKVGYKAKDTQSVICSQCHGVKTQTDHERLHSRHVTDKQYDCSWCHSFSRPERGLIMP